MMRSPSRWLATTLVPRGVRSDPPLALISHVENKQGLLDFELNRFRGHQALRGEGGLASLVSGLKLLLPGRVNDAPQRTCARDLLSAGIDDDDESRLERGHDEGRDANASA